MFLLLAALSLLGAGHSLTCSFPGCICLQLQSITFFCNDPVQDLSGYGQELPEIETGTFSQASFVTDLNLANNAPLLLFSDSFEGLTNLTQLDLSGNDITSLPNGVFSPLTTLTSLNLSSNSLSSLNPEAFTGLDNLVQLSLGANLLSSLPLPHLLLAAPALQSISLFPNPIDCGADNITELFTLVRSGVVVDGNLLVCSNGSKFADLILDSTPTTTVAAVTTATTATATTTTAAVTTATATTTTPTTTTADVTTATATTTTSTTTTAAVTTATATTTSATTADVTTATATTADVTTATITTTNLPPPQCQTERTFHQTGSFDWPDSSAGTNVTLPCPYGPQGGVARRKCQELGEWSTVDEKACDKPLEHDQLLATLAEIPITAETSVTVASQLAELTSDPRGVSVEEIPVIVDIAEQLAQVGGSQVQVLNDTLQALNSLVGVSVEALRQADPQVINSLRDVLDSLLLGALSIDKQDIVLSFSNLAVGGAFLPPTSDGQLLAAINKNSENGLETIQVGGANDDGDILVDIEGGVANSSVQITVYSGDELFTQSGCSNSSNASSVGGDIIVPIISVINQGAPPNSGTNEVVTITYNLLGEDGMELICVRWNSDPECGRGRWDPSGCSLTRDTGQRSILCRCEEEGTYAIISFGDGTTTSPTVRVSLDEEDIIRIIFYVLSSLSLVFYLIIPITILVHSQLRSVPVFQVLCGLSLSQGLTHLLLLLSYELSQLSWLCYTLGLLFHFLSLVTLNWMTTLPVVIAIKVFKRIWYEKVWLSLPFAVFCIAWPTVPVAIYGGLRYSIFDTTSSPCWLEASVFPNTFTYLFAFTCLVTMTTLLVTFLLLVCSDYSLELSTYFQPVAIFINLLFFILSILLTFFTAAAPQFNINPHHSLLATSITILTSGAVFFVSFGLCKSKIRNAMVCKREKEKPTNYASSWQEGERHAHSQRNSALSVILRGRRRPHLQLKENTNINYVDDYLGFTHSPSTPSPVPLAMLGHVHAQGRVKRNAELGGVVSGAGPQRRLIQTSEA